MHIAPSALRQISTCLFVVLCVAVGGCNPSPPPPAKAAPAALPQTSTQPTLADNMTSTTQVKGDEPLPPNHPPLPSATPPHPTGNGPNVNGQIAAQHPKALGKTKLAVAIPDSVKGKWASATLAVSTGGAEEMRKVAIGDQVSVGKNQQLRLVHYVPAYTSDFQTVTSSSNEEVNPAVQIQVLSNGQVVSEGWVFAKLPEFNSFRSEQIKVRLVSAERTGNK
jgi:hypothetical protein